MSPERAYRNILKYTLPLVLVLTGSLIFEFVRINKSLHNIERKLNPTGIYRELDDFEASMYDEIDSLKSTTSSVLESTKCLESKLKSIKTYFEDYFLRE